MKTLKKLVLYCFFIFAAQALMAQSALQQGDWAKVQITESGVYKITYEDVLAMGFEQPSSIQIFGNGVGELSLGNSEQPSLLHEIAIYTSFSEGKPFSAGDYVLFYADVPRNWKHNKNTNAIDYSINSYTTKNHYFIRINSDEQPLRIQKKAQEQSVINKTITSFDNVQVYEKDNENALQTGRLWLEPLGDKTLSFSLPNLVKTEYVKMKLQVAARYTSTAQYALSVNSQTRPSILIPSSNAYATLHEAVDSFLLTNNSASVKITKKFDGADTRGYLDYCLLHYRTELVCEQGKQLVFRNYSQRAENAIGQYEIKTSALAQVWNVTNPEMPQLMTTTYNNGKSIFTDNISQAAEYVTFTQDFKKPEFQGKLQNQNILAHTNADMVIVCANELRSEAQKIADLHAKTQNLKTVIVSQQEIFNEFSSGRPDPTALRNYFSYLHKTGGKLQYVLLFGDASYDNRNFSEEQIQVISYQTIESLHEEQTYMSDDFFGIFDVQEADWKDDLIGEMSIAIGRLPVNSLAEARTVTQKMINYTTSPDSRGDWQNYLTFLADDADKNQTMHASQADRLTQQIAANYPQFNFDKIYADAYKQVSSSSGQSYPDATRAVNERMINGSLVFNYTGHGSSISMAQEKLMTTAMVELWGNSNRLPLIVTASCEISRFDDPSKSSLGEKLLMQHNGGAIALFSAIRTVYAEPNYQLNSQLYNFLFELDEQGNPLTIGEAIRRAKNARGRFETNKRRFILLGNPALQLAMPKYQVSLDSINNLAYAEFNDALRANQKVRLVGTVRNHKNETVDTYNGDLYITVFDKPQKVQTLGNDNSETIDFEAQKNILFRGLATVKNGTFDANIIIPQDIAYFEGDGKLSFFANDTAAFTQATGSCFLPINGSVENSEEDNNPPKVEMFLNSYDFVNGGITNENPLLLVKLSDSSGINISDIAIGHSILLVIDGDERNPIVLNNYYTADKDTYISGKLAYQLLQLSEGEHSITLSVWDTQNNQTEQTLQFYVTNSSEISLARVYAYPNPTSSVVNVSFEHNQAGEQLNVTLFVYNTMGEKVAQIQQEITAQAKNILQWNCQTTNRNRVQRGIYHSVLRIQSPHGSEKVSVQKIMVLD